MIQAYIQSTPASVESTPASVAQPRSTTRRAISDEALIARIEVGDKSAMQDLFARYRIRVFHFVLRTVRDHGLAEDVVSETFLDVWRQAKTLRTVWLSAGVRLDASPDAAAGNIP
jgi:hypothetical protein